MTTTTQQAGELELALRNLTAAVRAFADGDMSNAVRDRLFLSRYDGPEQKTFGALCNANDAAESALRRAASQTGEQS